MDIGESQTPPTGTRQWRRELISALFTMSVASDSRVENVDSFGMKILIWSFIFLLWINGAEGVIINLFANWGVSLIGRIFVNFNINCVIINRQRDSRVSLKNCSSIDGWSLVQFSLKLFQHDHRQQTTCRIVAPDYRLPKWHIGKTVVYRLG